jgi:hypothetical protein
MSIKKFIVSDPNFDMEDLGTGSSGEYIAAYNTSTSKLYLTNTVISGSLAIAGQISASSYAGLPDFALKSDLVNSITADIDYNNLLNKPNLSLYLLSSQAANFVTNTSLNSGIVNYNNLSNKPNLTLYALKTDLAGLSPDYNDLLNKPNLSLYALKTDLSGLTGDYENLTNDNVEKVYKKLLKKLNKGLTK